jgi:hypothetical protein
LGGEIGAKGSYTVSHQGPPALNRAARFVTLASRNPQPPRIEISKLKHKPSCDILGYVLRRAGGKRAIPLRAAA